MRPTICIKKATDLDFEEWSAFAKECFAYMDQLELEKKQSDEASVIIVKSLMNVISIQKDDKPKVYADSQVEEAWYAGFNAGTSESLGYVVNDFNLNDYTTI